MSIESIINDLGVQSEGTVAFIRVGVTLVIAGLLGWLAYVVARKWLARLVMKMAGRTAIKWDDLMFDQKFFNRLGALIAPIVIRISLETVEWQYIYIVNNIISVWITIASVMLVSAVLDGVNRIYESYPVSRDRPIKVFMQVVMIFLWCAAVMVVISIFTSQSLAVLLGGLTAFAAVLMLIFQDSILGFVAGIQLSANHMVRIGDWIVMPGRGADGDVIEINLTTVKVQNWDKTITTIPTHKLVSESFTNWRGMEESNGRRIKRSVNIDVNSIHYLSRQEMDALAQSDMLNDYMKKKLEDLEDFNSNRGSMLDERHLTNIGTFRGYLESWLSRNPSINQQMTHMVRQLQPGATGLPLEIYCFSARQAWVEYEQVQSDIFDHVYAVMGLFGLRAFQYAGAVPTDGTKDS